MIPNIKAKRDSTCRKERIEWRSHADVAECFVIPNLRQRESLGERHIVFEKKMRGDDELELV